MEKSSAKEEVNLKKAPEGEGQQLDFHIRTSAFFQGDATHFLSPPSNSRKWDYFVSPAPRKKSRKMGIAKL